MNFQKVFFYLVFSLFCSAIATENERVERKDSPTLQPISTTQATTEDYIVGPGDFFEITADYHSFVAQVSPEGFISINRFGGVKVANLTLKDAKTALVDALAKRYQRDRCFVQLTKVRLQSIGIFGAIAHPSYYDLPANVRPSQIIQFAGGPTLGANTDSILVIHRSGDTSIVNLYEILHKGNLANDKTLEYGDLVYIPKVDSKSPMIYALDNGDAVAQPWRSGRSIKEYLERMNLFDGIRNLNGIYWASKNGRKFISIQEAEKQFPQPGDTIDIAQNNSQVFVGGQVMRSGPFPYIPNARPIDYIFKAGTSVMADQIHRIRVVRKNGKLEYIDVINGQLYPDDYIELDMSALDYANKWTPIATSALTAIGILWQIYYTTIWLPEHK